MNNQKQYKDSIFRMLFNDPSEIRKLYNALGNAKYGDDVPVEIKTIQDTAYADIKNDLAFTIDNRFVVMVEHQSTINRNMPYRMLRYFEKIMRGYFPKGEIYRENAVKLPTPEFYVLYNGRKDVPEESLIKLSDSFVAEAKENSIELVVKVINVRYNKDARILNECQALKEYSIFIDAVEQNILRGHDTKTAIEKAVEQCTENDVLKEFLSVHKSEVINAMEGDISFEEFVEIRAQEQYEIGLEKGLEEGEAKGRAAGRIEGMTAGRIEGLTAGRIEGVSEVLKVLGISEEEYQKKLKAAKSAQ